MLNLQSSLATNSKDGNGRKTKTFEINGHYYSTSLKTEILMRKLNLLTLKLSSLEQTLEESLMPLFPVQATQAFCLVPIILHVTHLF